MSQVAFLEKALKQIRAQIVRDLFKSGAIYFPRTVSPTGLHFGKEGDTFADLGESVEERVPRSQKEKP